MTDGMPAEAAYVLGQPPSCRDDRLRGVRVRTRICTDSACGEPAQVHLTSVAVVGALLVAGQPEVPQEHSGTGPRRRLRDLDPGRAGRHDLVALPTPREHQ